MSLRLLSLPDDILFNVTLYLTILDILALRKTCRALHAFGGNDQLWHRLISRFDLPLNLPPNVTASTAPAELLQQEAIKAIRLELNWRKPISHIHRSVSVSKGMREPYTHMQFLPGGRWLLTSQRYHRMLTTRTTTRICVWSFTDVDNPRCVFRVELAGTSRNLAMELKPDGISALLVFGIEENDHKFLEMRTISLREHIDAPYAMRTLTSPETWKRLELPPYPTQGDRVIQDIQLTGGILTLTVAIFGHDVSWHILLMKSDVGELHWVSPRFTKDFGLLQVRTQGDRIFLFGQRHSCNYVHVHKLPLSSLEQRRSFPSMTSPIRPPDLDFLDLGPEIYRQTHSLPDGVQTMADTLHVPRMLTKNISVTMFDITGAENLSGWGYIMQYPIIDSRTDEMIPQSPSQGVWIRCREATAQQLVQIGTTGRRMVWMEHELETGRNRVMKFQMAAEDWECPTEKMTVVHGLLLPPEPNLPFALNACNSLAFDELSGRLCLAFYDGGLHVLDFA
ncbi:hypothetical protein BXZ70DRAFT_1010686 [Cristinia sonorae]|uniref:F-box domain-containing protein n=1 Tax=Cristinia sonorae TaxID=1940300 RepID=A0A8K0UI00_9AGAR|nr:hypothetical protein BXZ70DRAFT_1010686 [Cristinia sonorae]